MVLAIWGTRERSGVSSYFSQIVPGSTINILKENASLEYEAFWLDYKLCVTQAEESI